jgi:hypothetical protein
MGHKSSVPRASLGGAKVYFEVLGIAPQTLFNLAIDCQFRDGIDAAAANPILGRARWGFVEPLDQDSLGVPYAIWTRLGLGVLAPSERLATMRRAITSLKLDAIETDDDDKPPAWLFLKHCMLQSAIAYACFRRFIGRLDVDDMPKAQKRVRDFVQKSFDAVRLHNKGHVLADADAFANDVGPSVFHVLLSPVAQGQVITPHWPKQLDDAWGVYFLSNLTTVEARYFQALLGSDDDPRLHRANIAYWKAAFATFEEAFGDRAAVGGDADAAAVAVVDDPFEKLLDSTGRFQIGTKPTRPVRLPVDGLTRPGVKAASVIRVRKAREEERKQKRREQRAAGADAKRRADEGGGSGAVAAEPVNAECLICYQDTVVIDPPGVVSRKCYMAPCRKCVMCKTCYHQMKALYGATMPCAHTGHRKVVWSNPLFPSAASIAKFLEEDATKHS